ncbi:MAG TPA: hypothetical protein PKE45_01655, partial [Caldilineaceae bacterium]|nr:hypothetical protein [Caldilineaceae bacterium]
AAMEGTTISAAEAADPLIKSETLDQGSNALLITSEPFCTKNLESNDPPLYEPFDCEQSQLATATFQQIYKQTGAAGDAQSFVLGNRNEEIVDQNQAASGRRHMDSIALDLTGDGIDTFVSAWEAPNQKVKLYLSLPISTTIQERRLEAAGTLAPSTDSGAGGGDNGHIHLAAGDLTGDGAEEFVVAYQSAESGAVGNKLQLEVYANHGGQLPQLLASIADEELPERPARYARFDVTVGDFDGDGNAEVALAYLRQNADGAGNWGIFVRIYDLVDTQLAPKAGGLVFIAPPDPDKTRLADLNLAVASGDVDQDGADEIAVVSGAFRTVEDVDPGGDDTYIVLADVGAGGSEDPLAQVSGHTWSGLNVIEQSQNSPTDVAVADLNNDGRAEIVLAVGPQIFLYTADDQLTPVLRLSYDAKQDGLPAVQDVTQRLSYSFLGVRKVGADRVEIALAAPTLSPESGSLAQSISLVVYTAAADLQSLTLVASQLNSNRIKSAPDQYRRFALAVGGPNGLRLGEPVLKGTATRVSQPLVILKAPPTHYDILDGEAYDVSDCYGEDVRFV